MVWTCRICRPSKESQALTREGSAAALPRHIAFGGLEDTGGSLREILCHITHTVADDERPPCCCPVQHATLDVSSFDSIYQAGQDMPH